MMELNLDYLNDARYLHNDFSGHTPFVSNVVKKKFSQNVTKDLVHKGDSVFPGLCSGFIEHVILLTAQTLTRLPL